MVYKRRAENETAAQARADEVNRIDFRDHVEHGRWLLAWYSGVTDSLQSRAVAVLGFTGIVLALAVQAFIDIAKSKTYEDLRWAIVVTAIPFLLSAVAAVVAITPRSSSFIAVDAARLDWHRQFETTAESPFAIATIGESIFNSTDESSLLTPGVLTKARNEVRARARWLTGAVVLLGIGITCLAVLILLLATRT